MNIQEINTELLALSKDGIFSMPIIEWWILKYSELHKKTYDFVHSQHLFTNDDGSTVRLPPLIKPKKEDMFLDLYDTLNTISEIHRYEKYFEQELTEYQKIKDSKLDLKNWIAKNEHLGAHKCVCFFIDYLDYSQNAKHLNVYVHSSKELEIYIDQKDFKNTIEFLEIFNELYWE